MRFGMCAPVSDAGRLAKIGYDYFEANVSQLAEMSDAEFEAFCEENAAAPIHAESANCMFPGSIRLTGEDVDFDEIQRYLDRAMYRLGKAGIKVGIFGSGGSRRVPEGFSRECAWEQLVKVGRMLGETAAKHGVMIALEPLGTPESNIINSQPEGMRLVHDVDHPNFKILCDLYHLVEENGTMEDIEACGDALIHMHIANPDGRGPMSPDDKADYKALFDTLRKIGFDARISIEGHVTDMEAQLPAALEVMKNS